MFFYPLLYSGGKKQFSMIAIYEYMLFDKWCKFMAGKITKEEFILND